GWHGQRIVDPAGDNRLVGVAFQKIDDHLLADARDVDAAPGGAGPGLRDADPAGAVLVALAMPVPVELHLHPAILVGEDLLARGAGHSRGLRPADDRAQRRPRWPERGAQLLDVEGAEELLALGVGRRAVALALDVVAGGDDEISPVLVGARVALEIEAV